MHWLAVVAADCDGGPQLARVYAGEDDNKVARRYGATIVGYGPTKEAARQQLVPALARWEERRRERAA